MKTRAGGWAFTRHFKQSKKYIGYINGNGGTAGEADGEVQGGGLTLQIRSETQGDGAREVGAALLELAFGLRLLYGGWRSDKKPAAQLRLTPAFPFTQTDQIRSDHRREIRPEKETEMCHSGRVSSSSFFPSV